jgi:hypothetical protein
MKHPEGKFHTCRFCDGGLSKIREAYRAEGKTAEVERRDWPGYPTENFKEKGREPHRQGISGESAKSPYGAST